MSFLKSLEGIEKPLPINNLLPPASDGNPGIRLELRELKKNKDLWNLYLIGLSQFQRLPQDHWLSFFQIAGIHGLPHQEWPLGDKKLKELNPQSNAGFCTHSSIIFLSWHRPYLAVFEFILYKAVKYVAQQFSEAEGRSRYVEAAKNFRMPYWDWARAGLPVFPEEAIDSEYIRVSLPTSMEKEYRQADQDGLVSILNPLYAYHFQAETDEQFRVLKFMSTRRWEIEYKKDEVRIPEGATPEQVRDRILGKMRPYSREYTETLKVERNLRERVVYLLQSYTKYAAVSHNKWADNLPNDKLIRGKKPDVEGMSFGSLEDIHNSMHVLVGGTGATTDGKNFKGHMQSVPISAFDPIFWLHHTNIDRLFTIWQALNDNPSDIESYVTKQDCISPTWVSKKGDKESIDTLLVPFYKAKGEFWDSTGVRTTGPFGYAYPETKAWKFKNKEDYRADVIRQLKTVYTSGSLATMIEKDSDELENKIKARAGVLAKVINSRAPNDTATLMKVLSESSTSATSAASPVQQQLLAALDPIPIEPIDLPNDRSLKALAPNNTYLEWMVNIKAQKHTLNGDYSVHVFLDNVEEQNTGLFVVAPNHVGTFAPLGQPEGTGCGKCRQDQEAGTNVTGQIPLTIALAERYLAGLIDSLEPEHVVGYLQQNLHWRVLGQDGQLTNRGDVNDLLVGVSSNKVTLPTQPDELPTYDPNITLYPEITTNRENGGRGNGTGITLDNWDFRAPSTGVAA